MMASSKMVKKTVQVKHIIANKKYVGEFKDGNYNGKGVLFHNSKEYPFFDAQLSGIWDRYGFTKTMSFEEVSNFLKNKYPQFKGIDYYGPQNIF